MSTIYVDTINEKTSGNGVQIPGHTVQSAYGVLRPGRDFSGDTSITSTSYTNLVGNVSGTVLGASLNGVSATSFLLFTYSCGLVRNGDGSSNSSAIYNIWETNDQKYVANSTNWSGSSDPYVAGHWNTTEHTGMVSWTFVAEPGFFSGDCNFQMRIRSINGAVFYYHWHSNRVGHFFSVQEIAQ